MKKEIKFSIDDTDEEGKKNTINFVVNKLSAIEQSFLIIKIIGIIARGTDGSIDKKIEQALHNAFQTGHTVEDESVKSAKDTIEKVGFTITAFKSAIGSLSDKDRDELISILIKDVKIVESAVYQTPVTLKELDNRFTNFKTFFSFLIELMKINLGFFSQKTV